MNLYISSKKVNFCENVNTVVELNTVRARPQSKVRPISKLDHFDIKLFYVYQNKTRNFLVFKRLMTDQDVLHEFSMVAVAFKKQKMKQKFRCVYSLNGCEFF